MCICTCGRGIVQRQSRLNHIQYYIEVLPPHKQQHFNASQHQHYGSFSKLSFIEFRDYNVLLVK